MYNNSETISANEVNKYIFCPYQWYYARLYGRKKIRELEIMRNEAKSLEDKSYSNFQRGKKHHKDFHFGAMMSKLLVRVLVLACIVLFLWWFVWKNI